MKTTWGTRQDLAVCFAWKQIGESAMMGGARDTITEVAVEDSWVDVTGCIRPRYHFFDVFIVLGIRGSLIF
jgi:hypothetical protein